jgi:uncharacterized protein (DUF488 family)
MHRRTQTKTIVSIGYERRDIDELVELLRSEQVELLVDVRLNAISRKRGFSKTALTTALNAAGIQDSGHREVVHVVPGWGLMV